MYRSDVQLCTKTIRVRFHPPPSTPFLGWGRGGGGEEFVLCFVFCVFLLHDTFPEPEPEPEPGPGRAAGQIQSNPILSYHIPHIPISHFPYPIFPCSGVSGLRFLRFTVYGLCLFYALQGTGRMDGSVRV